MLSRPTTGKLLLLGLFSIFILHFTLLSPIQESLVLIFGWLLTLIFLYQPKWGLLLIIILRPSIDKFSENITLNLNENLHFNAAALLGALVVVLLSVYIGKNHCYLKQLPLKKLWFVFVLICILSLFFSIDFTASVYELVRLISVIGIFFSFYILSRKEKHPFSLLYALIFSSLLPFLFATYQLVTHTGLGGTSGIESRLFGTFSHPNPFASFILIILVAASYLAWKKDLFFKKWFLYLVIGWGIFLLVETFSRGAWVAFLLFLFILSLLKSPRLIVFMALFSMLLFASSETIRYRVEDVYNPPADSSVRWRFAQWDRMYQIFLKRPLIGQGIGTETIAHEMEYGYNAGNQYTHNDFLRVALETGIPGLVAYGCLIALALFFLLRNFRNNKSPQWQDFHLFVLALFLAMISFSLTNNTLRETVTQWTLWSLIGTSLALSAKQNKD